MSFVAAYDAMVARFADDALADARAHARASFEKRTGSFTPDDAWFEARSRAFLDDALTTPAVLDALAPRLAEDVRACIVPFTRAHRGLFRAEDPEDENESSLFLIDVWSGAEFFVTSADESTTIALGEAHGLFDARLVGRADPFEAGILPGIVFHGEEATDSIMTVIAAAKKRALGTHDALDALLRMDHKWRSLSRMKASYAYREDALSNVPPARESEKDLAADARSRLTKRGR